MLLVKTKLGPSKIHGIGLFFVFFISKGTVIWKFVPGFDLKFTRQEVDAFPQITQDFIHFYDYVSYNTGYYILCVDNARFTNHSKNPNMIDNDVLGVVVENTDGEGASIALRDINLGEELTYDCEKEDAGWQRKLGKL